MRRPQSPSAPSQSMYDPNSAWDEGSGTDNDTDGGGSVMGQRPQATASDSVAAAYPQHSFTQYTEAEAPNISEQVSNATFANQSTTAQQQQPAGAQSSYRPMHSSSASHLHDDSMPADDSASSLDPALAGRSSVQANKLLVEMFKSFSDGFHRSHPFHTRDRYFRSLLLTFHSLAFLLVLAMMWAAWAVLERTHILVECCLLTVNWFFNAGLDTYEQYLTHTEMLRLLRARMELVLDLPPLAETRTTEMPPSSTFVRTLRDGIWRPLPMNLLVQGDLIELDADDRAPCPLKRVYPYAAAGAAGAAAASSSGPNAGANATGAPFTLSQAAWSSQTQLLAQQASMSNIHGPARGSRESFSEPHTSFVEQLPQPQLSSLPSRAFSDLSSILSNSAGEAEAETSMAAQHAPLHAADIPAAARPQFRARPSESGIELVNRAPLAYTPHPAVFQPSASVASSYSMTPSPMVVQVDSDSPEALQLPAAHGGPIPPPPPPPPPEVPSPPGASEPSDLSASAGDMSERSNTPEISQADAARNNLPPLQLSPADVHIQVQAADHPAPAQHARSHSHHASVPETPHSHLSVPHHHGHSHSRGGNGPTSPLSSGSSHSVMSMLDPETKEQLHQTDTTFLPATVLQSIGLQQQQQQQMGVAPANVTTLSQPPMQPLRDHSAASSNASTIVDHPHAGADAGAAHPAGSALPHTPAGGLPGGAPGLPGLFSTLSDEGPRHFLVEESPLRPQLEFILQPRTLDADSLGSAAALTHAQRQTFLPPRNTFLTRFDFVASKQKFVLLSFLLVYWILVFIRLGMHAGRGFTDDVDPATGQHTYEYIWWVLYCSALLSLPLLNLSNSFWLFVLDTLGNSILLVTQEEMQTIYDDELNNTASSQQPKKSTASLFSSASRKRAMKKRILEAAKAKARAAAHKKSRPGAAATAPAAAPGAGGGELDGDEPSVSSVSSASTSSEDTESTISSRGSDDDELDEDAHTYSIVDSLTLSASSIVRHGWDIVTGREFYITRTVNPLQVLGGITVFCCLDNEGILSENEPSADHICFLTPPPTSAGAPPARSASSSNRPHQHRHHHHHSAAQPKVVILDLMNDPEAPNGLIIEGDEWAEKHLNSLKPLGLNSILNNACNLPQSMLSGYEFSSTEPTTVTTTSSSTDGSGAATTTSSSNQDYASSSSDSDNNSGLGCLCMLGKEIGFDVHFIRQQYYIGKVIYTVAVQNTTTKIRPKRKHRLIAPGKTPSKATSQAGLPGPSSSSSTLASSASSTGVAPDLQILSKIHTMTSMSVQDRFQPSSLHLLTNGDPFLVLFHCTHFWNGTGIQPLSEHVRTQLLGIYQQWHHQDLKVLAFSYSPIFPPSIFNYISMFNPQSKVEYVIENINEELESRRRQQHTQQAQQGGHQHNNMMSSASSSSSLSGMSDALNDGHAHAQPSAPGDSGMTQPARRRYATEHSTIDEHMDEKCDDDDQAGRRSAARADLQQQHDQTHHDDLDHQHDEMYHQHDEHHDHEHEHDPFVEHSQQEDVHHAGDPLDDAHDAHHEQHPAGEYSRSYSHRSSMAVGHVHNNMAPFGSSQSHAPPPPPPQPPAVPTPAAAEEQKESAPTHFKITREAEPTIAGGSMENVSTVIAPEPVPTSVSSLPVAPIVADSTQYTLEAFTPRPRKHSAGGSVGGGSSNLVKSQSFPSGFQPHISLGSMLPGSNPDAMLQSNLAPYVIVPARSDSMPANLSDSALHERAAHVHAQPTAQPHSSADQHAHDEQQPPQPQAAVPLPSESDLLRSLQSSQIFLGMIAMRDQPKIEVRALVEDMKNAGIRFVFFSPDNERKTQAFGGKIGLFTDFNFYVSLMDPEHAGAGNVRRSQGKSQLPCGVSAIRNHLQTVDNVPLLVSLFTDCEPSSCREMIRIYQEAGESVMVMGSSLKVENTLAFMQADISASLDPMPSKECPFKTFKAASTTARQQQTHAANRHAPPTYQQILLQYQNANAAAAGAEVGSNEFTYSEAREFAASSAITSMPCALLLSATTDLHHFMALICQGRRLLRCMTQCLCFCMASYLTLALVLLLNFVAGAPPILVGYQLIWLIWVVIPLLSLSLLHTPRELDLMRNLPQKNTVKAEGMLTVGGFGIIEEEDNGGDGGATAPVAGISRRPSHDEADELEDDAGAGGDEHHHPRPKLHGASIGAPNPRLRKVRPASIMPDVLRYLCYFLIRFAPSAIIYLVLFLWLLHESMPDAPAAAVANPALSTALADNFYWASQQGVLFSSDSFQSLLLTVQNYALVAFVAALAWHSMGFVYRYESVFPLQGSSKHHAPWRNRIWIASAIGCVLLQVSFCVVSVFSVSVPSVDVVHFRWYLFLAWPLLILALDELCKRHDRVRRDFLHKKARQHFDTVLGMHSPK